MALQKDYYILFILFLYPINNFIILLYITAKSYIGKCIE